VGDVRQLLDQRKVSLCPPKEKKEKKERKKKKNGKKHFLE
jgi:hypothetical protein